MRERAEIEAPAGGIVGAEQTLHAFAEILRADEERFDAFVLCVKLDQADSGARGESGEEIFVARRVEVLAAVEIEHGRRILRWRRRVQECGVCFEEEVDS